jgi:non-structural maintenance of chromosomes element 4
VKQTSDATIDSRLLVTVGDLSYKKTNEMALGDSSTGVDVDEFVSKCIRFMKRGAPRAGDANKANGQDRSSSAAPNGTQLQRRRRRPGFEEDEDDDDQLNWAHLGQNACFLYNSRPCLSGFLLGPLSVQKRVRQQTQRKAREARADPANAVRPQELREEDMEQQETANLTVVCSEIRGLLGRIQERGEKAVEAAYNMNEDMTDEEGQDLMREHGLADDGQVPLFDFCVNPKSFGQTVENMFYVSFLIKEGTVGLSFDSRGMPTLGAAEKKTLEQRQEAPKNQAVFTLDFDMWADIIESHGILKSLIPHRREEDYDDGTNRGEGGGWYD